MKIKNFAILKGNGEIKDEAIIYKSSEVQKTPENEEKLRNNVLDLSKYKILNVRSEKTFKGGTISFKIRAKSKNTGALLVLKAQNGSNVQCGPTLTEHKFAIAKADDGGDNWRATIIVGDILNYDLSSGIEIKVHVEGSSIHLYVENILLCEAQAAIKESPIEFRLCSDADFEIFNVDISETRPKIFVVMQFSKEYDELYSDIIIPVSEAFGYECVRGDEFYSGTPILKDIVDSILKCAAIIAEITPDNPNVFYEIGYAHAIGKPTILLCDRVRSKLPFDLSGFRTLFYDNTIAGKSKVEQSLRKYFENF